MGRVFFKSIKDDRYFTTIMHINHAHGFDAVIHNDLNHFFGNMLTGSVNNFSRFFINNGFCQETAFGLFRFFSGKTYFVGDIKQIDNFIVGRITQCPQNGGYGQFSLGIDIEVHDIIDISTEFHPTATVRNYSSGI